MNATLFFSFMGSLMICMALIPALSSSAWRLQFIDLPRDRHMHREPVAKIGGIAFAAATFLAVLIWAPKDQLILASVLGGATILLFGIWDDRIGLSYRMKFAGQILAAAIVIGFAGVRLSSIPFVEGVLLPVWLAVPLSLIIIVAVTNAVNLSDGLDGLAGGLSLISFAGIAYLAYQAGELQLVVLAVSILGGLLGFLRFNTYPARIFMGDAGSQFLGHYLAVTALLLTDATRTIYSPLLALFIWGVPLLDTVAVMGQRYLEGRSPFLGDRNHVHHKLLARGLTHGQAVTVIYLVQTLMVGCAYLLRWQSDVVLIAVYAVFAAGIFSLFVYKSHEVSIQTGSSPNVDSHERAPHDHRTRSEWVLTLLYLTVPVYLIGSLAIPQEIPPEAGLIAGGLVLGLFASLWLDRAIPWAVRAALYIGSTCLMYYGEVFPRTTTADIHTSINVAIAILAVLVVTAIRLSGADRFQTTPLDYLIILLAGAMLFFPEMAIGHVAMGSLTAKLLILFFAFELLLLMRSSAVVRLGVVSLGVLSGMMWRAWWP